MVHHLEVLTIYRAPWRSFTAARHGSGTASMLPQINAAADRSFHSLDCSDVSCRRARSWVEDGPLGGSVVSSSVSVAAAPPAPEGQCTVGSEQGTGVEGPKRQLPESASSASAGARQLRLWSLAATWIRPSAVVDQQAMIASTAVRLLVRFDSEDRTAIYHRLRMPRSPGRSHSSMSHWRQLTPPGAAQLSTRPQPQVVDPADRPAHISCLASMLVHELRVETVPARRPDAIDRALAERGEEGAVLNNADPLDRQSSLRRRSDLFIRVACHLVTPLMPDVLFLERLVPDRGVAALSSRQKDA